MTDQPSPLEARLDAVLARSPVLAPLAILLGAIALGLVRGPGAAVLALAGGLLLAAIAALWNSLRVLGGDAPLSLHEAIDLGAPTEQQERKQKVLLAIQDLKREHAIGKISDDDFKDLLDRHRAEAKQLLREMDDDLAPARKKAEELLAARLEGKDLDADESDEDEDDEADDEAEAEVKVEAPKKKAKKKARR